MTSSPISDLNPIFNAAGCQLELHSNGKNYDYVKIVTYKIFYTCYVIRDHSHAIKTLK